MLGTHGKAGGCRSKKEQKQIKIRADDRGLLAQPVRAHAIKREVVVPSPLKPIGGVYAAAVP